jgi:hypothetical protein
MSFSAVSEALAGLAYKRLRTNGMPCRIHVCSRTGNRERVGLSGARAEGNPGLPAGVQLDLVPTVGYFIQGTSCVQVSDRWRGIDVVRSDSDPFTSVRLVPPIAEPPVRSSHHELRRNRCRIHTANAARLPVGAVARTRIHDWRIGAWHRSGDATRDSLLPRCFPRPSDRARVCWVELPNRNRCPESGRQVHKSLRRVGVDLELRQWHAADKVRSFGPRLIQNVDACCVPVTDSWI